MISFNKLIHLKSDYRANLQTDLSKVLTTWTEFYVESDWLPNIVPWYLGFPIWCLALIIPSVSKSSPFLCFREIKSWSLADWVNRGMSDCMTASETIRSRSYVFMCAAYFWSATFKKMKQPKERPLVCRESGMQLYVCDLMCRIYRIPEEPVWPFLNFPSRINKTSPCLFIISSCFEFNLWSLVRLMTVSSECRSILYVCMSLVV